MSPLYLKDGKLLLVSNALATGSNCCCECHCNNCACTFVVTFQGQVITAGTDWIYHGNVGSSYEPPEDGTSECWTFGPAVGCGKNWIDLIGLGYYLGEDRLNDLTNALAGVPDNLYIMFTVAEAGGVVDPPEDGRGPYCGGCGSTPKYRIVFYVFDQLSNCCPHNQQPTIFFDTGVFKPFEETQPTTWPSEGIIGGNPTIEVNCES